MRHWLNHLSSRAAFAALRAVVIELFSSQDCSSWPPAAALSGELGVWGAMEQYFSLMTQRTSGVCVHAQRQSTHGHEQLGLEGCETTRSRALSGNSEGTLPKWLSTDSRARLEAHVRPATKGGVCELRRSAGSARAQVRKDHDTLLLLRSAGTHASAGKIGGKGAYRIDTVGY